VQGGPGGQFSYSIPLRKRTGTLPPGIQVSNNNGAVTVNQFSDAARYRINLIAQAQNLTNHANYTGYSGVLISPFFGQPTAVSNTRRVDLGVQFNF
jgi:tetrahydromethanopterin S-methyltransferase subunit F